MIKSKSWNADEDDKKTWDTLFPCRTNDVEDYINSEGSDEDMREIRFSVQIEVITQRDEIEDVGTLKTSEAAVEDIPLSIAPIEMPAPEVPSAAEAVIRG